MYHKLTAPMGQTPHFEKQSAWAGGELLGKDFGAQETCLCQGLDLYNTLLVMSSHSTNCFLKEKKKSQPEFQMKDLKLIDLANSLNQFLFFHCCQMLLISSVTLHVHQIYPRDTQRLPVSGALSHPGSWMVCWESASVSSPRASPADSLQGMDSSAFAYLN